MPETAGEIAAPISGGPQHAPSPTTRAATECEWKPAGLAQRSATARATTVALTMQSLLMETTSAGPYPARRVPPLERRNFTLSRVGSFRNERVSTLVRLVGSEAVRSAREEPPGRPLVAVEQKRAFCSRTIARPCSMRQGERGELGKCARREVHGVAATFGIVDSEYGNGA